MRLNEILSPADFWDDARHTWETSAAEFIDQKFFGKTFSNEAGARAFVLHTLQAASSMSLIKTDGSNEIALAKAAPVYFDGNSYRIGTKNVQPRITWNEIKIKPESRRDIAISADASAEEWDCDFKVKFYPASKILPDASNDIYCEDKKEKDRILRLADEILDNKWVTPLFVAEQEDEDEKVDWWIIEGQHRARALFYHLKLPTIPAYTIQIFD